MNLKLILNLGLFILKPAAVNLQLMYLKNISEQHCCFKIHHKLNLNAGMELYATNY